MRPPLEYLAWASALYPKVDFDLASSGVTPVPAKIFATGDELGDALSDARAGEALRDRIARRFAVDRAEVASTLGTSQAIFAAYAALLAPGDTLLVEAPTYEPMVRVAEGLGARIATYARSVERNGALDLDEVARAITPSTRVIAVTHRHNPTGAPVDDATMNALVELAARAGATLLVNEVYREIGDARSFDEGSAKTARKLAPNVVAIGSLTKVFGLGWARIGWVLGPARVVEAARDACLHASGGMAPVSAALGVLAFDRLDRIHGDVWQQRASDAANEAAIDAFIAARPHLALERHPGSIFGFVRDRRGVDLRDAIERGVDEEQVIVAPGSFFGVPAGFRVRYGSMPHARFVEGLERLGRMLARGDRVVDRR
jgi:aspartate/methionine/tyrosine aminotransferase